jgi:Skp family chaperone for outer membrane proteins
MKNLLRAVLVFAGLGLLTFVSRSWSEPPKRPPAPRTRVALVNLSHVVKNYNKFKSFQDEMKAELERFQARDREFEKHLEKLEKRLAGGSLTPEETEEVEEKVRGLRREREDNSAKAKNVLSKKSEEQMVVIYKEIQEVCHQYAAAHGIELVLHYNDAAAPEEYWSPANVMRKMQSGATTPLYAAEGMDIGKEVIELLNERLKQIGPSCSPPGLASTLARGFIAVALRAPNQRTAPCPGARRATVIKPRASACESGDAHPPRLFPSRRYNPLVGSARGVRGAAAV